MNLFLTSFFLLGLSGPAENDAPKKEAAPPKRKPMFTIGRETTYITGPLDKDGYVDYVTALNERLREGVTPQNNANVLLWKAFGPHPDRVTMPPGYFKWLQIPSPPEKGDYFVDGTHFLKEHLKAQGLERTEKLYDAMEKTAARPWKAKDYPEIAEWLKVNEKPLAVVIEATKRTHYYNPLVPTPAQAKDKNAPMGLLSALVPSVHLCRQMANALTARAMLKVAEGRPEEAWQDLVACHRLGRHAAGGATLIEGLVGLAIESTANTADLAFIDSVKLDAKKLRSCLKDLQALPPLPSIADKIHLSERFIILDTVMYLAKNGDSSFGSEDARLQSISGISWDPALRRLNQMYTRMAAVMRLKDRDLRAKQYAQMDADIGVIYAERRTAKGMASTFLGANSIGEAFGEIMGDKLVALLMPAGSRILNTAERNEQEHQNVRIAFALAAYRSDEGRYPNALDTLVPKYLATVPLDLFNGKALVYRSIGTGYLLYSVGINGRDDEGRGTADNPPGDDLAVRMPLPKLDEK